jgi:hypothetical protein
LCRALAATAKTLGLKYPSFLRSNFDRCAAILPAAMPKVSENCGFSAEAAKNRRNHEFFVSEIIN